VTQAELTRLFSEALSEVGGRAVACAPTELATTLAGLIRGSEMDAPVLVDPALSGVAAELAALGVRATKVEGDLTRADLDGAAIGITGVLCGIADTGTIVIGPGKGYEGILATVCPHHIAVLPTEFIRPDLPTALAALGPEFTVGSRVAFVTGPSRTSDIELIPVLGVHGPLRLEVVIVGAEPSAGRAETVS
jgi:L-lactate dehydrogenase complex protein LldG